MINKTIEIFEKDGIELKIFTRDNAKLPYGFRSYDVDSGNVIGIIFFPTLEMAQKEFTKCKNPLVGIYEEILIPV